MSNCTYTNNIFTSKIDSNIEIIFECGSRDCLDAIEMLNFYKPEIIYSFECNPESVQQCLKNINGIDKIKLIDKAVGDINGTIDFFATDMEKSKDKNIGASSALYHLDNKKDFFQKKISVESITLENFLINNKIPKIDLLCMDLQGYEKNAINGLGKMIDNVKYIILESSISAYYNNEPLYDDITLLMNNLGFKEIEKEKSGNIVNILFTK